MSSKTYTTILVAIASLGGLLYGYAPDENSPWPPSLAFPTHGFSQ